jgi:ankyrin repeat protein
LSRAKSKFSVARLRTLGRFALQLVPAAGVLAVAGNLSHPAVLVLLLMANSLAMSAVCEAMGFGLEGGFGRTVLRRGAAHFLIFAVYVGAVTALVGMPLLWLLRGPSLEVTLALSAATVLALVLVWRVWPIFGLVFVWDDAYPDTGKNSWLYSAVKRSAAFGSHLTGEHELFFSHGLPVSMASLMLALGALSLAGLCGMLPSEIRVVAMIGYGLLLPLSSWLVANRTLRALLTTRRADRQAAPAPDIQAQEPGLPAHLPSGLAATELSAALLRAARAGHVELALAALERNADPNTVPPSEDRDQRSVLVLAALLPEIRLLRALIAKRVDINQRHLGLTALLAATRDSQAGRPDAVLTLLANGADTTQVDAEGNTALHHAARVAEPTIAAMLLDAGASATAINRDGYTPLGCAALAANWTLLRFLIEHGAKWEIENAVPALVAAAAIAEDDVQGVRILLKQKAKPDARAPLDRTALMMAALHGHRAIAKVLLDAGADANLIDVHGTTATMEAARAGAAEIINLFAGRKIDINLRDHAGRTALVIACQSRQANLETVRALLMLGADPALPGRDGRRAVDNAAMAGRWDLVAALDSTFPLPAHVADIVRGTPLPGADSPAHLLDALRFGHWNIAEGFRAAMRQWPAADKAEILHALGDDDDVQARAWLLAHSVDADAALADGVRVLDAWLTRLPQTLGACHQLLRSGASAGGGGKMRQVLEAARDTPTHHSPLLHLAQEWFQRGGDLFQANAQGETALHLSAALGSETLTSQLLQCGFNPNIRDARGCTPLHAALRLQGKEAVNVVRSLVRHGADPTAATAIGETCLGLGLARAEPELLRWLQWRAWPLPRRALRAADLPAAAIASDVEAVSKLIEVGLPLDAVDAQGATALIRACGLGHIGVVQQLLSAGANAEFPTVTGATPLSAAVSARRDAIVEVLIGRGVQIDHRLPGGGTALMIAAALGFPEITERLLKAGAAPNLADEKGTTALHAAAQFAFHYSDTGRARNVLQSLCSHGADANPRNAKGQTPLQLLLGSRAEPGASCQATHLAKLLPVLLDHGAQLDAQDDRGVSPLHACAIHGLLGPAQQLLARGAARDARDCLGRTPGDLAHLLGYAELAQQLGGAASVPSLAQMLRQPARPVE